MVNDAMAYYCGMFFGKTPLIKLSPKKTVEGFVGGAFFAFLLNFLASGYLGEFKWLVCNQPDITFNIFQIINCETQSVFLPSPVTYNLGIFGSYETMASPV